MVGAGKRAVGNSVIIHVGISFELADPVQVFGGKNFAAVEFLTFREFKRIRHPIIHAEIEIAHDEDGSLESLCEIERLVSHRVAFFDASGNEDNVLGVAVRTKDHRQDVGLLGSRRQSGTGTDAGNIEDDGRDFRASSTIFSPVPNLASWRASISEVAVVWLE